MVSVGAPVRRAWSESDRFVPRRVAQPMQRFMALEAAGGAVMLAAATVALGWANSPWHESYSQLWSTPIDVRVGGLIQLDHLSLQTWVNDALMAVFFLLAGLEIKRELVHGDLRDKRAAALPALAAVGGMLVPALIFAAFTVGHPGSGGWGVPMATDIAFAVGVVTLLGRRVPAGAKVFLLTLAIVDDIGAIVVIAVFYAGDLSWGWLAAALAGLAAAFALRRSDVQSLAPYLGVGVFVWVALLQSGVHATLAGVAFGIITPAWPLRSPRRLPGDARRLISDIERAYYDRVLTQTEFEENEFRTGELVRLAVQSTSPIERLTSWLHPWVVFVILPVFALANAGVHLSGDALSAEGAGRVFLGVSVGLVAGKAIGVLGASWLAVRLGIGVLPPQTNWRHMGGVAVTAGVGFTVALFVTGLSFDAPVLADAAKLGILAGSVVAGAWGAWLLRGPGATKRPTSRRKAHTSVYESSRVRESISD
ncbi:MAG: Na+/H+ antiporter NhaA [Acidimicrobiales bacterium]